MAEACADVGATHHAGGTYVCMEGPQFSTRAESELYRSWGMDIIGMTNLQEAKLAREAEICYSTLAMVTDYDCWHPDHDAVTVDQVIENLGKNAATAKAVLRATLQRLPEVRDCECASALRFAIMTRARSHPAADQEGPGADHRQVHQRVRWMSILVVGSVAFDTVETPFGKAEKVLGGSASFFSVAASFFAPVELVGVVGVDFGEKELQAFRGRDIDLAGLERMDGKTFHWQGKYSYDLNARETIATDLNVFEHFKPKIPPAYRRPTTSFSATSIPCCSSRC